jgi:hypothetical protein
MLHELYEIPNQQLIFTELEKLGRLKPEVKENYIDEAVEYLRSGEPDHHKSWACTTLEFIGGSRAYGCLEDAFFKSNKGDRLTRHFALKGMKNLAGASEKEDLLNHCKSVADDEKEMPLLRLGASSVLFEGKRDPDKRYEKFLTDYLTNIENNEWRVARPADLKVFRDFPTPSLQQNLCRIAENEDAYLESRQRALEALGGLDSSSKKGTIKTLGMVLTDQRNDRSLRLGAAQSLLSLRGVEASQELLDAIMGDDDAEVRKQATSVLKETHDGSEAVRMIIDRAMQTTAGSAARSQLIEAIRMIDKDRATSTDVLMKAMMEKDVDKAKVAEEILTEIGGWRAFQSLAQRNKLIQKTDDLFVRTENDLYGLYNRTITRAEFNFKFAMYVNAIVVCVGIVLIGFGVIQLVSNPGNFADWAGPSGGGLFMFIVTKYLDNPRRNGREDLGVLIMSNIIFLGFLRKLSEIDATFKYMYLEKMDFTVGDVEATVKQIEAATKTTLEEMGAHLGVCFKPETTATSTAPPVAPTPTPVPTPTP